MRIDDASTDEGGNLFKDSKCGICGNSKAVAGWMGQDLLAVCRGCAIEVLPKLLADAVVGKHSDNSTAISAWKSAEKHYWYAVANRFCHEAKEAKKKLSSLFSNGVAEANI